MTDVERLALDIVADILSGLPTSQTDEEFLDWLRDDCHYIAPMQVGRHWVACEQLMFHGSLIGGDMGDVVSVRWRYCYPSVGDAFVAMHNWIEGGCKGEPAGWHKRRSIPIKIEIED